MKTDYKKICIGTILGTEDPRIENRRRIIKITRTFSSCMDASFQGDTGVVDITIYEYSKVFGLPLTEEFLDFIQIFNKIENKWISSDSLVFISKNSEEYEKKWSLKIFDENKNLIFFTTFDYIHELQFYCELNNIHLNIKYGTVRFFYQDYINNL